MLYQSHIHDVESADDIVDRLLVIVWVGSEIALDVFGMFFWSALGLCLASIMT